MPRTKTNCPRLVRLAAFNGRHEASVRSPATFDEPQGTITYHISRTAVGAIAEAMIEYPGLVGVSHFTENGTSHGA